MDINEKFEFLKDFYLKGLGTTNFYSRCSLMSTYNSAELKELFDSNSVISQYFEIFLAECYQARDLLNAIEEEISYIEINNFTSDKASNISIIFKTLNCLKDIAIYFDEIGIDSRAKIYFEEYDIFKENNKKILDFLRTLEIKFKYSNGNEVFERERKKLLEFNTRMIEQNKKIFLNGNFSDEVNMIDIQNKIYDYYFSKKILENYEEENQRYEIKELCKYIFNYSLNPTKQLLEMYNKVIRLEENIDALYQEIIDITDSLNRDSYVLCNVKL